MPLKRLGGASLGFFFLRRGSMVDAAIAIHICTKNQVDTKVRGCVPLGNMPMRAKRALAVNIKTDVYTAALLEEAVARWSA
ncbi:MAG: hypothetical protein N3H31_07215 [Candidatus Nezhaarchaeota archaeon]|nr:hypothetical protein [Candidatus Nezhaarchaeota archaeon]